MSNWFGYDQNGGGMDMGGGMGEMRSDMWINQNIPGGVNSLVGERLDNYAAENPNPTYGRIYGGALDVGDYGGGYGQQHGGWKKIVCQTPYGLPNRYLTGPFPEYITTGDFNNDVKLKLTVTNAVDNAISLLFSRGDGSFNSQATYPVGSLPISIIADDFHGDGKLDLALVNYDDNNIVMLLGNGDGTFQRQKKYSAGVYPVSITAGDFNHGSKLDLAVTNSFDDNTIGVLLGNEDGTFQNQIGYTVGAYPLSVTGGAFRNDFKWDLVVTNGDDNSVAMIFNSCS